MAYTLSNKCAKNLCKRTVLLQLIIKNVVTFFGTQCRLIVYYQVGDGLGLEDRGLGLGLGLGL